MTKLIERINSPADLKQLNTSELELLCAEIRAYLVDTVSKTGGHLSSNLGAVELTVALERVLELPRDKVIWDVGHQSYVHKILTGRREALKTVRTKDGLCGFTDPKESEYDASVSGHSSTSLSTAMGLAMARDLAGESFTVASVIGDGALTGGMALEALDHIGHAKTKMLIVLNDNDMSISRNVGGISSYLSRARSSVRYTKSKQSVEGILKKIPGVGESLAGGLRTIKDDIKYLVTAGVLFEEMGLTYLGPVDGHDISKMEDMFRRALRLNEPVIVHVVTKKGKGYRFAEKEPHSYHGVAPFDKSVGIQKSGKKSYSSVFGDALCVLADKNENIVAITPSMTLGSGLCGFEKRFPRRFFDVGIAEQHAVTFAAGLAIGGKTPVAAVYSSFLQRAYDSVIEDVAISNLHVVFALDRAGMVPGDGATHQGLFDLSYLTHIPNMTVLAPSSFSELEKMLDYAINVHNAPIAIRYPRGGEGRSIDNGEFVLGRASVLKEGGDVSVIAVGSEVSHALDAADMLEKEGISVSVIDLRTVKPLDIETIKKYANNARLVVTAEANVLRGGVGEEIAYFLSQSGIFTKTVNLAAPDKFAPHASEGELLSLCRLDAQGIYQTVKENLA